MYKFLVERAVVPQFLLENPRIGGNLHFPAAVVQPVAVLLCREAVRKCACARLRLPGEGRIRGQYPEVGLQHRFQRLSLFQCLEAGVFDEEPVETVPAGGVRVRGVVADDAGDAGEGLDVAFMCCSAYGGRMGGGLEAGAGEEKG